VEQVACTSRGQQKSHKNTGAEVGGGRLEGESNTYGVAQVFPSLDPKAGHVGATSELVIAKQTQLRSKSRDLWYCWF